MSVVLESVAAEGPAEAEPAEAEPVQPAEAAPVEAEPEAAALREGIQTTDVLSPPGAEPEPATVTAETVPEPKKRGRPRKEEGATPKAPVRMKAAPKPRAKRAATAPVAPPPAESDEEEGLSGADLETEILEFLVQRKTQQQDRRRQLWAQLAGL